MEKLYNTPHKGLMADKSGILYNSTGEILPLSIIYWSDSINGYYACYHNTNTHFVHITMCETFHPKTEDDIANKRVLVNHKDGNSLNNAASNVEWASYSDNLVHAYKTGLRSDNNNVYVKNLSTNVITMHYSQAEAARSMNSNTPKLCGYFSTKRQQPYLGMYGVWREGETPSEFTEKDLITKINGSPVPIIAFSKEKLRVFKVGSQGRATKLTGIKRATIGYYLKNRTDKKGKVGDDLWEFWFENEYNDEVGPVEIILGDNLTTPPTTRRKPLRVSVTDLVSKEVTLYDSIMEFINKFKLPSALTKKKAYLDKPVRDKWLVQYIR